MKKPLCILGPLSVIMAVMTLTAQAQIDPAPRQILHLGFDQSLNTDGPMGAYAFYYWNMPNVPSTNQVLRVVIAPGYVDSELGFKGLLGEHTDLAVGAFGGLFANSYNEVRGGNYYRDESFNGDGGGASVSIYHLFNPASRIPLTGVLRGSVNYHSFSDGGDTADNFKTPADQPFITMRTGFRWGGKEPMLGPALALEISAWYEFEERLSGGDYGFDKDRELEFTSHRIFGRAQLNFTVPESKHYIMAGLMGGALLNPDRFSAFRLGGMLPYASEFPLYLPGYFNQELSAEDFGLLYGLYTIPLGESKQWALIGAGAASVVKYVDGLGQGGAFNSGVGGGMSYTSSNRRWKAMSLFGYGIQAHRGAGEGGYSVGLAFQYNFGELKIASDRAFEELENARTVTR